VVLRSEKKEAEQDGVQVWQSRTVSQSCNPTWNERVELFVYDEDHDEVEIQVWDEDDWSNDDLLGKASLKLGDLVKDHSAGKGLGHRISWIELSTKGQIRCRYGFHRFVGDEPVTSSRKNRKNLRVTRVSSSTVRSDKSACSTPSSSRSSSSPQSAAAASGSPKTA